MRALGKAVPGIWWIIGAALVLRGLFAAILPFGTDEAYALAVGRSFSLSFFDHPPLGFWAPALMEAIGAQGVFAYRVPSLVLGAMALWFLYLTGRRLGGEAAGLWTAGLAAMSPAISYSGALVLPDAPLFAALSATIYCLVRLAQGEADRLWLWLGGGVALALGLASKYQAGLLPLALLLWLATSPGQWHWLRRPGFYIAVAVSLLGLAPVVVWNISHDWASFAFHGDRAGGGLNPENFVTMAAAQAIYLLPVILAWALRILSLGALWRRGETRLLILLGLAPIVMFNAIYAVSEGTLPHWTMPGWLVLLPLVGMVLAQGRWRHGKAWLLGMGVPLHLTLFVVALHLQSGVLTRHLDAPPGWDRTVPFVPLGATRDALTQAGVLAGAEFLAAPNWIEAGHIAAALGGDLPMRVIGGRAHHFQFMAPQTGPGAGILIGIATRDGQAAEMERLIALATAQGYQARALGAVPVDRGGRPYFALPVIAIRQEAGTSP
jgi:4-amino-4-deoxy-L-arabinose transferase-like glycosyltransferase